MAANAANEGSTAVAGEATERRIVWLTPLFGAAAAIAAAALHDRRWALGLLIGTLLASLNFRLLRKGMDIFAAGAAAQSGAAKPHVPDAARLIAALRYALLAAAIYVSFEYLGIPLASMLVGLCALGAASIAASVYEIVRPEETSRR
jgi:hypothetical protein